ncbi:MAG: DUF2231 domain-containing protein [Deltaproteobacteria bacterium]
MNPWEIHPALVHFPIALLLSATLVDVVAAWRKREGLAKVGLGLLVAGEVSALVAASAGVLAYFTVPTHTEEAHVRMLIHPALAASALVLYAIVAVRRRRNWAAIPGKGLVGLSLVAAASLVAAGALGGYLVFHDGVGVTQRAVQDTHHH